MSMRVEWGQEDLKTLRMEGMRSLKELARPFFPQAVLWDCPVPWKKQKQKKPGSTWVKNISELSVLFYNISISQE